VLPQCGQADLLLVPAAHATTRGRKLIVASNAVSELEEQQDASKMIGKPRSQDNRGSVMDNDACGDGICQATSEKCVQVGLQRPYME
jgi:hypothetical protein